MVQNPKKIKLKKNDNKVAELGDAHIGHQNHQPKVFKAADDKIWEKKYKLVTMGDMIECREPSHPLYVPGSMTINDQLNTYFDFLQRYADEDRLLGVLIGNHEHGMIAKTSDNPIQRWCKIILIHAYSTTERVAVQV
jgi:hypothetical protein